MPRSPDEDDRSELLRQAEPIDYKEDLVDNIGGAQPYGGGGTLRDANDGYQSRPARFSSNNRLGNRPPRNIFDDV